jgi:DNA-binding protein HU-beta
MAKKPAKAAKKPMKKVAPKKVTKVAKPTKPVKKVAAKPTSTGKVVATPTAKARVATKPRNTSTLSYTQSEFLENIRAFCGLEKRSAAKQIVDDIANFVMDSLKRGYKIPLMGLGKLQVRETKARTGRNPATGAVIQIPKKKKVRFTVAKALKERVL